MANVIVLPYLIVDSLLHSPGSDHSLLQIGLSVNVGRLNVADVVSIAGVEKEDVGGDDVIAVQADKITDTNF